MPLKYKKLRYRNRKLIFLFIVLSGLGHLEFNNLGILGVIPIFFASGPLVWAVQYLQYICILIDIPPDCMHIAAPSPSTCCTTQFPVEMTTTIANSAQPFFLSMHQTHTRFTMRRQRRPRSFVSEGIEGTQPPSILKDKDIFENLLAWREKRNIRTTPISLLPAVEIRYYFYHIYHYTDSTTVVPPQCHHQ